MPQSGQKIPLNTHWNTGGTLVLTRVALSDSGKYVCVANNTMGQDRAERDVTVTGRFDRFLSLSRHAILSFPLSHTVQK